MKFTLQHLLQYAPLCIGVPLLIWIAKNAWQRFILPAKALTTDLSQAIDSLRKIKGRQSGQITDLDKIKLEVMKSETLTHLWNEYQETLHPQKQVDEFGQEKIVRWRSTTMSETFFTEQVLVDTPLKTEFYKHLPGILTGIGIISTFTGLILGLWSFDVDGPPAIVRASLGRLIQGVGESFIVSAFAIVLAMLFTYIEKYTVTKC